MKTAIVGAVRTPIGDYGGTLRMVPAYDLASAVLSEIVRRAKIGPDCVDQVIMGQNYQSGEYVNIARMSLLKAGWPLEIPGITIDRRCCSGLDTIILADSMIRSGGAEIVVAGGVESMSTAELYVPGELVRWGLGGVGGMPRGHGYLSTTGIPLYDRIQRARAMSQPKERFGILPTMMTWAESAAKEYNILREEADRWALMSHQRALKAIESGRFSEEIVPVRVPQQKGEPIVFSSDEHPRHDTSLARLSELAPVLGGVCTAGNSSGENDGAAACLMASENKLDVLSTEPMAYLKSYAQIGADPMLAYKAVPLAVNKALKRARLTLSQIDLIEIHEAFATQILANIIELGMTEADFDRVNVNGSCIALGHPLGCTGARIMTTLLYEMKRRQARYGLVAVCGGGGMGVSVVVEKS